MATPAFVYAFDNLGPDRFVELCGLLLASRYKGFLLSGPGADGGVDGEADSTFGELRPSSRSVLLDELIAPTDLILFQFKHKVVARVGESSARSQLLNLYKSTGSRKSEVSKELVLAKTPTTYVLVTNVELGSQFRERFVKVCRTENPDIENFVVIGLDDLESWVTLDRHLRAQFFPTIFGRPRFNLRVKIDTGYALRVRSGPSAAPQCSETTPVVGVTVMNVGESVSYVASITFKVFQDGEPRALIPVSIPPEADPLANPPLGDALEPGRRLTFRYGFEMFTDQLEEQEVEELYLSEVLVRDQVDNLYAAEFTDEIRRAIFEGTEDERRV